MFGENCTSALVVTRRVVQQVGAADKVPGSPQPKGLPMGRRKVLQVGRKTGGRCKVSTASSGLLPEFLITLRECVAAKAAGSVMSARR